VEFPVILSVDELKTIIAGDPIGDIQPYRRGIPAEIEAFLKQVVARLEHSPLIEIHPDWEHYGSGYASYAHVFCFKKGGRSTVHRDGVAHIDGITLYLCRLAPIAVYGPEHRTRNARGGSGGFLDVNNVGTLPAGDWSAELREIHAVLTEHGFGVPTREQLAEVLPFKADIPTIFDNSHVFDAIFYWED
jgi:hypothetical protein